MAASNIKVLVTNLAAIKKKYGPEVRRVQNALKALLAADKERGLSTRIVDVSSKSQMAKFDGLPVTKSASGIQNKRAVDAIYGKLQPSYLVILGATDVVPHVQLTNPNVGDGDEFVPSDLPYACDHSYSKKVDDFIAPTRVVSRLPDIKGMTDCAYFEKVIHTAALSRVRHRRDYNSHLAITAKVWTKSTALTMQKILGSSEDIQVSPGVGPDWTKKQLQARTHFINCHGAPGVPAFYGSSGTRYAVAESTPFVQGQLVDGTIAAAECCYGGLLYDPSDPHETPQVGTQGLCSAYLGSGAYCFLGSTTIAYGSSNTDLYTDTYADLITRYFMQHTMAGASVGRALLQARQDFVHNSPLDPIGLKTLGQFNLLGDASIHAVQSKPQSQVISVAGGRLLQTQPAVHVGLRRSALRSAGAAIARSVYRVDSHRASISTRRIQRRLSEASRGSMESFYTYPVKAPRGSQAAGPVHVAIGRIRHAQSPMPRVRVLVAHEHEGVMSLTEAVSK